MPQLEVLQLAHAGGAGVRCNADASKYRPLLPSLKRLVLGRFSATMSTLHALARWTDIRSSCAISVSVDPATALLAVKGWGVGWLQVAFASPRLRELPVVLVDDADVGTYLAALDGLDSAQLGFKHSLSLGAAVTPNGFSGLLSSAKLPSAALSIRDNVPQHRPDWIIDWDGSICLHSKYFQHAHRQERSALTLRVLCIADSHLLTDQDVALLVSTAPGLHALRLLQGSGESMLTDLGLCAMLTCQQLEVVEIDKVGGVTARGVLVLLTALKGLQQLEVGGVEDDVVIELFGLSIRERWDLAPAREGTDRRLKATLKQA
jgi:hypothetical protein